MFLTIKILFYLNQYYISQTITKHAVITPKSQRYWNSIPPKFAASAEV